MPLLLPPAAFAGAGDEGLGAAFGGEGNVFRTKRGLEKGLFYLTIALSCLFFGIALLNIIIK